MLLDEQFDLIDDLGLPVEVIVEFGFLEHKLLLMSQGMLGVFWHGKCLLELIETDHTHVFLVYVSKYLLQSVLLELRDLSECFYEL